MKSPLYSLPLVLSDGQLLSPEILKDKVILIVNTATRCGLASQLEGLQALEDKYKSDGFMVIGMPCDQFLGQEPVSDEDMQSTCATQFGVNFLLLQKANVNGPDTHPLFQWLKRALPGTFGPRILWNYTKFLIDRSGQPVERFGPKTVPQKLEKRIQSLLKSTN
jgi:glutathione peroxidase